MRRILVRLIVLGVIMGGGWISYQLADATKCNGPKTEQWANASLERIKASNADMNSLTEYTTSAEVVYLASRSQARYMSQQGQEAPACLSNLQQKTSEGLYYEWKAYDAAASGSFDLALSNLDKAQSAREAMEREYYRLAAQYGWDTSK